MYVLFIKSFSGKEKAKVAIDPTIPEKNPISRDSKTKIEETENLDTPIDLNRPISFFLYNTLFEIINAVKEIDIKNDTEAKTIKTIFVKEIASDTPSIILFLFCC